MNFPALIQRYKGTVPPGQKALGTDTVVTGDPLTDPQPGSQDNVVALPSNTVNGWPVNFVLLAYNGPDATYRVRVYVWEGTLGTWQMISGGDVSITKGIVAAIPVFAAFGKGASGPTLYIQYTGSAAAATAGEHNVSVSAGA